MDENKKIRIIDPESKAVHDPLFRIAEEKLREYIEDNKEEICKRQFQTNQDFVFRKIADEGILVPTGKTAQAFNGMINLSPTSVFLWQVFNEPHSINDAVAEAERQYETDDSLREDVMDFVVSFYRMGLLV